MGLASWGSGEKTQGQWLGPWGLLGSEGRFPGSLLAPARLTSTLVLLETLGPHHLPLLSSSSMTVDSGLWGAEL